MKDGELLRVRCTFGLLAVVPAFLAGWLGWVQIAQAGEIERDGRAPLRLLPRTADGQGARIETVPSPRGTIVDRHGSVLALDCETYEVRARIAVPLAHRASVALFRGWLAKLLDDLSLALVAEPDLADRADIRRRHVERLEPLFRREFALDRLPAEGPVPADHVGIADLLVAADIDMLSVVQALRVLAEDRRYRSVGLHFLRSYRRAYPDRELTHGLVGHLDTRWTTPPDGGPKTLRTIGVCGLESLQALEPDAAAARRYLEDGRRRRYFMAPVVDAPSPNVLHSTIDIELQRIAMRELAAQAEAGAREGNVTIPQWGAMVLVEVQTGDVLAAASWHRDAKKPEAAAFTPYQSLCEPGSIVKPLVFGYAMETGALDWSRVFDCTPFGSEYRERIAGLGRSKPVRDDHDCTRLTPHGILVNSSNIGASYVGLLLEREQWRDYMKFFGFGEPLGLNLPNARNGGVHKLSFDPHTPLRSFRANSAISFSFGYELQVTPLHVARAYLRLLRGGNAELRLCRGALVDGRWCDAPVKPAAGARLRPEIVSALLAAMTDVVSSDPHSTGVHMHTRMLKELGIDLHGVIAGKTGTAASHIGIPGRGRVEVRNASFVGFMPVDAPRWLAVCVLQKDDSARFYGGSYAAPPVVRLLLQCQRLEQQRQLRQESQVGASGQARTGSGSPGDSGWSGGAPETTSVGR